MLLLLLLLLLLKLLLLLLPLLQLLMQQCRIEHEPRQPHARLPRSKVLSCWCFCVIRTFPGHLQDAVAAAISRQRSRDASSLSGLLVKGLLLLVHGTCRRLQLLLSRSLDRFLPCRQNTQDFVCERIKEDRCHRQTPQGNSLSKQMKPHFRCLCRKYKVHSHKYKISQATGTGTQTHCTHGRDVGVA